MPKQSKYHKHLLLLPHDLYWRVFRFIKAIEARECKRVSLNEFIRSALENEMARGKGGE